MRTRVIVGLIAVLAALAGCGGGEATSRGAAGEPGGDVPESLMFAARTVDGDEFQGATLSGRPAVLWFWAAWCPTCKRDASVVRQLAAEYDGRVGFVGVGGLGKTTEMQTFVKDNKIGGFVNLADEAGDVWRKFEVKQQSTYVLIAADGKIVHTGALTTDQLEEEVGKLAG